MGPCSVLSIIIGNWPGPEISDVGASNASLLNASCGTVEVGPVEVKGVKK